MQIFFVLSYFTYIVFSSCSQVLASSGYGRSQRYPFFSFSMPPFKNCPLIFLLAHDLPVSLWVYPFSYSGHHWKGVFSQCYHFSVLQCALDSFPASVSRNLRHPQFHIFLKFSCLRAQIISIFIIFIHFSLKTSSYHSPEQASIGWSNSFLVLFVNVPTQVWDE